MTAGHDSVRNPPPLDERLFAAFQDAGLDESDAQAAMDAVLQVLVADARATADEAEWVFRSMTFYRTGEGDMVLHPVGQWLRDRYASAFLGVELRASRLAGADVPLGRLCSQCGEREAAMVKVGTADGWCTRCLDDAADKG